MSRRGRSISDAPVSRRGNVVENPTKQRNPPVGQSSSLYASTVASVVDLMEGEEGAGSRWWQGDKDERGINEQQWVLQRKKIGLSRRTKASLKKVRQSQDHHDSVLDFIKSNFSRKECCHFVQDKSKVGKPRPLGATPGRDDARICHCGKPEEEHHSRAAIVHDDLAKASRSTFDPIGEESEDSSDDYEHNFGRRRRSRDGSAVTTTSELSIIRVEERSVHRRRQGASRDEPPPPGTYHTPPTEHYTERKLDQQMSITSVNSSIINGVMTSIDTNNSLKMDTEKTVDDLGAYNGSRPNNPQHHVRFASNTKPGNSNTNKPKEEVWNEQRSLQEFPTNAFGQIEFVNEDEGSLKPSKYVRITDQTEMPLLKELLVKHWGLFQPFRPHLALSLIGGAKNFKMEGKKKETFKQGLISAAKSTNALILTGGNNTGTMKLVGDAIREGQYMVHKGNKMTRGLKLLGLCSYGYIKDFHLFVNQDPNEFNYVRYNSNVEIVKGDNVPLNGDHTHFLMVDDGSRYRFFGAYTDFITRFETMVRDDEMSGGLGIPIVTLLLEGGKDAIRIVKDRLASGIPCVAVEGSGRAADIISYAHKNAVKSAKTNSYTLKEGHVAHLMKMLTDAYGDSFKNDIVERDKNIKIYMNWVLECVRHAHIITTFDIRREEKLDKKILSALLKTDKMPLHQQLYLAMVWDRVDLVEEKIMVRDAIKTSDTLNETMKQALVMGRVNFIQLMVMNGFVIRNFLTVEMLAQLYSEAASHFKELPDQLRRLTGFKGNHLKLRDIHKLLVVTMKAHRMQQYERDKLPNEARFRGWSANKEKGDREFDTLINLQQEKFEDPYVELFLWAVLTNRPQLIEFFWYRCKEPILMAVVAASYYSKLIMLYKGEQPIKVLSQRKTQFQDRANKLIELASETNMDQAISLLDKRINRFGDRNLMELAAIGHLRNFIANPTCQTVLHTNWKRGFTKLPSYICLIGFFFPLLVFTPMVRFVKGLGDDGGKLSPWQKMYVFYRSPIVKYTGHCVSQLLLMLLYSYVALFSFRWEYQIPELLLYAWIIVMIVDEIREVVMEPARVASSKIQDYFNSVWNKFDLFIVSFAVTVVILKNFKYTFEAARVLFAINCALFYMRMFRIYHASKSLGPKLVIFHRMIPEIITFIFLLVVFILAYGVASQAIIDPYRQFKWSELFPLLFDIIFLPYWQMYGELSLDSIKVVSTPACPDSVPTSPAFTFSGPDGVADVGQAQYCYPEEIEDITHYNYVTPALLAIYLLVGNVMLLNLLIAIFTSVFEEVHENSTDVWKWEMYRLVDEYDKKPGLPPPLVIFEDIFKLFKGIWKRTCRRKKENLESFMKETMRALKVFERDLMSTFVEKEKRKAQGSLENRINLLEKKTDQLLELFEDAPNEQDAWGATVDAQEKLYSTDDDDSDSSSSSSNDQEQQNDGTGSDRRDGGNKYKEGRKEWQRIRKHRGRKFKTVLNPKSARIATARTSRAHRRVENELNGIRERMDRSEEQRREDMREMEQMLREISRDMHDRR